MRILAIFLSIVGVGVFSGCATNGGMLPVRTKAEARVYQVGDPVTLKADYMKLVRYWDENVPKPVQNFGDKFTQIDLFESEKTAHLVCGNGFVHGFIELKGQPDGSTIMTTYAWGGDFKTVTSWRDALLASPLVGR